MEQQLFSTLIKNLLSVNVFTMNNDTADLQPFEDNYCFDRSIQPMFTSRALSYLMEAMQDDVLYEIMDNLNVCLSFFHFQSQTYFIGPYVKSEYDAAKMQSILVKHDLPASYAISLKLYYTAFPMLSTYQIEKVLYACMRSFVHTQSAYNYRRLQGLYETIPNPSHRYAPESIDYDAIYKRYDAENHFLKMIEIGNVKEVLIAFSEMRSNTIATSDNFSKGLYQNPLATLNIIRSLARKSAENGGLSVVTIDEITQKAAQRMSASQSQKEQAKYTHDMILELTQAVHEAKEKTGAYSAPVASVIEYLSFHYSQNLSLQKLADVAHISEPHLAKIFKRETGQTCGQYIAQLRCEHAARLLKETDLEIQEISSYVGYPDNNYFVKVFKKQYGMTPSQYR